MTIDEALRDVRRLFLDTAPIIYLIEANPTYVDRVSKLFDQVEADGVILYASPITLAECLVLPYRMGDIKLADDYFELLTDGEFARFLVTDRFIACRAGEFRARWRLALTDALQVASAESAHCDAILTNDVAFRQVNEPRIIMIDDIDS